MASSSRHASGFPDIFVIRLPRGTNVSHETQVIPSGVVSPSTKIVILFTRLGHFPVEHAVGDNGKHRFNIGWKDFVEAHELEDRFVLHLKKIGDFSYWVRVLGREKWMVYPITFPDYDSDDDIVDESSFAHKLEEHNVIPKDSYLELPRSFCTDHGISDGKTQIQMFGPAMDPNEVTLSVKESGCRLSKGWDCFVADNGLKLEDKVVLTFIGEKTIFAEAFRHL